MIRLANPAQGSCFVTLTILRAQVVRCLLLRAKTSALKTWPLNVTKGLGIQSRSPWSPSFLCPGRAGSVDASKAGCPL